VRAQERDISLECVDFFKVLKKLCIYTKKTSFVYIKDAAIFNNIQCMGILIHYFMLYPVIEKLIIFFSLRYLTVGFDIQF
jgi:hypothetical protein